MANEWTDASIPPPDERCDCIVKLDDGSERMGNSCYDPHGKFVGWSLAWKMVYSGYPPTPDRELYQCKRCTDKHGALPTDPRIKPECSAGICK